MASPAGRRLRPLAVGCALLLVFWGLASAGSLIAQINELNDTGWPDENDDGEIFGWIFLYLSAAASGCWVALWGLFGLAFRPPLHLGALALVVAVALEVVANVVQAAYIGDKIDPGWSFGDQLGWYGDRVTFQADGLVGDAETRGFFVALPLVTASVPLAAWLVVLFSGAGRKQQLPFGAPYPQQYPQQYAQQYPQPYPQGYPQPYPPQQYQQPYPQPQYQPQQYQQPAYQPPPQPAPQPAPQPPPQPRVPWQQVPPVVRGRPAPPRPAQPAQPTPPDQQETRPYQNPPPGA